MVQGVAVLVTPLNLRLHVTIGYPHVQFQGESLGMNALKCGLGGLL